MANRQICHPISDEGDTKERKKMIQKVFQILFAYNYLISTLPYCPPNCLKMSVKCELHFFF